MKKIINYLMMSIMLLFCFGCGKNNTILDNQEMINQDVELDSNENESMDAVNASDEPFEVQEYKTTLYAVADNVGAHSEPNSTSETVYKYIQNEKANVIGLTENGWYQVLFNSDNVGYVYPNLLTEKPVENKEEDFESVVEEHEEDTVQEETEENIKEDEVVSNDKDDTVEIEQQDTSQVAENKPNNKTPGELWEEDWINNVINRVYDPDRYSELMGYGQADVSKISYFEDYIYQTDESIRQYSKERLYSDDVWSTCTESEKQQLNDYFATH